MDTFLQDLRYALRGLAKDRAFTAVAVATLALGIGANTAIFSVVDALLLQPLPFAEPERLVGVWQTQPGNDQRSVAPANFLDWRRQSRSFAGMAAYGWSSRTLLGSGEPLRVEAVAASESFSRVLGVAPRWGRTFSPAVPDAPDAEDGLRQAVLSDALWRARFGADPGAVGRTFRLDRESFQVAGVMPAGFAFPDDADLWLRAPQDVPELSLPVPVPIPSLRDARYFHVVGRLAPGVSLAAARSEMGAIGRRLELAYPEANRDTGVNLVPLQEQLLAKTRPVLLLLLGVVGFVLLIACANVANLLLARAARRGREIAVRTALGAGRGRLVRQLLTESAVVALAGGALGALAALAGARALAAALPVGDSLAPAAAGIGPNGAVLGFTLLVSLLAAMLFGLAPALRSTTRGRFATALREAGRRSAGPGRDRLRGGLVAVEVALALVLVTGAGLLAKSLLRLQGADLGLDPERVLTFRVSLPGARELGAAERLAFFDQVLARVGALPGAGPVGMAQSLPLTGDAWSAELRVEGRPAAAGTGLDVAWRLVTPGYLAALRVPVLAGRAFTGADREGAPPVALVNQRLAHLLAPGGNPLGLRIGTGLDGGEVYATVVGVVADAPQQSPAAGVQPEILRPAAQPNRFGGEDMRLVARTAGDPMALAPALAAAVREVSAEAAVSEVRPMASLGRDAIARQRRAGQLLGLFAAVALLLAAVGLYGLMSCLVDERTHELGVRLALGARRADLLRLVMRRALALVAAGSALGLAGALGLTRLLAGVLYEVTATDPPTFGAVLLMLVAAAALASWLPAERAAAVDPIVALRHE